MAGVTGEHLPKGAIDGVSFVPLLKEAGNYPHDRAIFWHYPNTYGEPPFSSLRQGNWKLIYQHAGQLFELYNVAEDIGETTNLAEANPERLRKLASVLGDHLRATGSKMSTDQKTGKPTPYPDEVAPQVLTPQSGRHRGFP